MLREPPPLLGLCRKHEVKDVGRQEAECAVVVLGAALVVAAGAHSGVVVGRGLFGDVAPGGVWTFIRAVSQQSGFDGVFEGALGNRPGHSGSVPSPRMAM